jgi:rhamnosyltransferase subunit B
VAAQVVVKLGCRAVFLTTKVDQVPKNLPDQIFVTAYAPFSLILPRASVMVHHGGIGTTSQCLAAGIPQLVVHMTLDQPDNAARIERLGVGLSIGISRLKEESLKSLLKRCLTDKKISKRAALRAQDMQRNKPVAELLDWIEKMI